MQRSFIVLVVLSMYLDASSNLLAQSPISQYLFDGDVNNASTFSDKNGDSAPDGTLREGIDSATAATASPVFTLGVDGTINGAIVLDGIDDWIDITTHGHPGESVQSILGSGPGLVSGTVMGWIKTKSPASAQSRWLMGSSNSNDFQSWRLGWNGSQLDANAHAADSPTNEFSIVDSTNNTSWADGDWHHIAVKWDGFPTVDEAKFYVDGVAVGTPSAGSLLTASQTQSPWEFPLAIGARNNAGMLEGFWEGAIDDLQVFAEALNDQQIQSIFDAVTIVSTPDFDEDDDVDGSDFLIWQRGFGTGTTFAEGDANNDGNVDAADLVVWEGTFGTVAASSAVHAVPEPGALVLFEVVMLLLVGRRGRRC